MLLQLLFQDRLMDESLKSQIKNRTLPICRLFLLTLIFQNIRNSSAFTLPLSSIYIE